jgi:hypothetical protein
VTLVIAKTFANLASALALAVLMLPVAAAARRRAADRGDLAQAAAVGIAAAAALLVATGLLLSAFGEVGATGWLVAILVVDAVVILGTRDRLELARRALPAVLAAAALGMAAGALALSHRSATDQARAATFTQLWLLPRGQDAAEVGVRNEEGTPVSYRLRVIGPPAEGGEPLLDRTVALGPSQTWVGRVELPPTAGPERVTAEVSRIGDSGPYRTAHLWTSGAP